MSWLQVVILAVVQGLAELLPVSSSAHVVVAEKLMGLDPADPQMTLLLVMLHTGTMLSVIVYFWKAWRETYFSSAAAFKTFFWRVVWATLLTGVIGEVLKKVIEKTLFAGAEKAEIEQLFGRLDLIAPALAAAGVFILVSGLIERRRRSELPLTMAAGAFAEAESGGTVSLPQAVWMGIVQGLALPFRGFSRSGTTISAGMLAGAQRQRAERFSFALAVVLTPPVVGLEVMRLVKAVHAAGVNGTGVHVSLGASLGMDGVGLVLAFLAGLAGLRWLSAWLEEGRWWLFGVYCLVASTVIWGLYLRGI